MTPGQGCAFNLIIEIATCFCQFLPFVCLFLSLHMAVALPLVVLLRIFVLLCVRGTCALPLT